MMPLPTLDSRPPSTVTVTSVLLTRTIASPLSPPSAAVSLAVGTVIVPQGASSADFDFPSLPDGI